MKRLVIVTLVSALFLAIVPDLFLPAAQAQVSVGIRIGPPPAPRVLKSTPRRPGADYEWIEGYWYPAPNGRNYRWHQGYWTRIPFPGAHWIEPRYEGGMFYNGYWEDRNRRMDHDHRWDHDHDRDWNRDHDRH